MGRNPDIQVEKELKEGRVQRLQDGVLFIKEPTYPNPEAIDAIFDRIDELAEGWDKFYLIVEYPTNASISADTRARIRERFSALQSRIQHLAAVVTTGVFVKLNFMLLAKWTGYRSYMIYPSFEKAFSDIKERIEKDKRPT